MPLKRKIVCPESLDGAGGTVHVDRNEVREFPVSLFQYPYEIQPLPRSGTLPNCARPLGMSLRTFVARSISCIRACVKCNAWFLATRCTSDRCLNPPGVSTKFAGASTLLILLVATPLGLRVTTGP